MGRRRGSYEPDFPVGTIVRIKDIGDLLAFQQAWDYHNPLRDEQLTYASRTATISEVGFYHGGDEVYVLAGIAGVWHEECLEEG
jgi:hypothetical protein